MSAYQPIRGTRDLYGTQFSIYERIVDVAKELAMVYGYDGIETPVLEYTNVFQRTLGETTDMVGKEMYTFSDRGGDSITLRPEGTAPVVRALISLGLTQKMPKKLMYHGPMFRYERPQKGRYRQFYQLGIECLGISDPLADVECMALACHMLEKLGIQNALHLNTLGCADSRSAYRTALVNYFEKYVTDLSADSQARLHKNPLRILDSKNPKDQEICTNAPVMKHYLQPEAAQFFETVCQGLDTLKIPYVLDAKLVRGIDYYCHTAFEFKSTHLGAQDSLGGGGRYDSLMKQMGGPETPGVGWAFGVDRLMLVLENTFVAKQVEKVALIPVGDHLTAAALALMQTLRHKGIACEMTYSGHVGKRLKYAHKIGCTQAIIFGDEEWSQGNVLLRNLQFDDVDGKEQLVSVENLLKTEKVLKSRCST